MQASYFPENFDARALKDSYRRYQDSSLETHSILSDIYNVSLLRAVCEQRRRLLYKNVFPLFTRGDYATKLLQ